jgi:hypothetical protein
VKHKINSIFKLSIKEKEKKNKKNQGLEKIQHLIDILNIKYCKSIFTQCKENKIESDRP